MPQLTNEDAAALAEAVLADAALADAALAQGGSWEATGGSSVRSSTSWLLFHLLCSVSGETFFETLGGMLWPGP